jgi:hypothetical protein
MYILVYIKKFMSLKPNPKGINIILNILKVAQFEFLPRAPFYIDTPLIVGIRTVVTFVAVGTCLPGRCLAIDVCYSEISRCLT